MKTCVFVRNKSIIKGVLTLNRHFWTKYLLHNDTSSSEKVHPRLSSHIKIHWHICSELFWTVLTCKCKWYLIYAYFSPDSEETAFSLEEAILWTFSWKQWLSIEIMDLCLTNTQLFTSQDNNWWTVVVYITCPLMWCLISCLESHSDGTHSLHRIYQWASDVMLNFGWAQGE